MITLLWFSNPRIKILGHPFHFFNSPLHREDFDSNFIEAWNSFRGFCSPDMFLTAKLRFVRKAICKWRNTDAVKESKELIKLWKRVDEIENLAELRRVSEVELSERRDSKSKIVEPEKFAKLDIQQKAEIRWVVDVDEKHTPFP